MLRPLEAPAQRERRTTVYDLEWYPDRLLRRRGEPGGQDALRVCGVYDVNTDEEALNGRRDGYRRYLSIADFVEGEFTKENSGRWYYAHAGGLADVQFVLEHLAQCGGRFRVSAIFSGSSAVVVRVQRGRSTWTLIDSYFTLRAKLADIGDWLGLRKGSVAFDTENLAELIEYNEQDCVILHSALKAFEAIVLDLGSEINVTLASTALRLIRRVYLREPISTSEGLNERLRSAYVGGRTEVHRYGVVDFSPLDGRWGYVYDINASYPHAMTMPLPGRMLRHLPNRLPSRDDVEYIANVTITVPSSIAVPPLPHLAQNSLFFPTGTLKGEDPDGPEGVWICRPELEHAVNAGCVLEKVHECVTFARMHDFGDFSRDLYKRRLEAQADDKKNKSGPGYLQAVLKLLMASGYGKMGESSAKQQLLINPTAEDFRMAKAYVQLNRGRLSGIRSGVYLFEMKHDIPHAHIPTAAYVTSYARVGIHRHLMAAKRRYYCDTDSLATDDPNVPTSDALGALKLEKKFQWGLFEAPKFYALQGEDGVVETKLRDSEGGILSLDMLIAKKLASDGKAFSAFEERRARPSPDTLDRWLRDLPPETFRAVTHGAPWAHQDATGPLWAEVRKAAAPAFLEATDPNPYAPRGQLPLGFGAFSVKAKGFPSLNLAEFHRLRAGGSVPVERMLRVRELLRYGELTPRSEVNPKQALSRVCPKRHPLASGETVPWDVAELRVVERGEAPVWRRVLEGEGTWRDGKLSIR